MIAKMALHSLTPFQYFAGLGLWFVRHHRQHLVGFLSKLDAIYGVRVCIKYLDKIF